MTPNVDFPAGGTQFSPNQKYVFLNIRIKHPHMPKMVSWVVSNIFLPIKKNCKKNFFTVRALGQIKHVRHGMSHFFENGSYTKIKSSVLFCRFSSKKVKIVSLS